MLNNNDYNIICHSISSKSYVDNTVLILKNKTINSYSSINFKMTVIPFDVASNTNTLVEEYLAKSGSLN
jgi:hypothetical protein